MRKIIITYKNRITGHSAGVQTFAGRTLDESCNLAVDYQSQHPELVQSEIDVH